jgi:GNAT superfamily N-acetyltransferase
VVHPSSPVKPPVQFKVASLSRDHACITALSVEYLGWIFDGVEKAFGVELEKTLGMSVAQYVPSVLHEVCGKSPPQGIFYLVSVGAQLAGMGGLRGLNAGRAEIKRLYIRPAFRGQGLGHGLLQQLLGDARRFGYEQACLDTGPFQQAAHRLYERLGFVDCAPYEGTEVAPAFHAGWRFMARAL